MDRFTRIVAWLALLTLTVTCARCTNPVAQTQRPGDPVGADIRVGALPAPGPSPQGKAEGKVLAFEYRGADLRAAALAHPVPEVWLQFDASIELGTQARRVELPAEAQRLLKKQWEKALAAKYDWELGDMSDIQKRRQLAVVIWNSADDTQLGLTKVMIEAPNGKRKLSMDEAGDLAHFITEAVFDTIKQVKTYRSGMD